MVRHKRLRPSAARYVDSTGTVKSFAIELKILQRLMQDIWSSSAWLTGSLMMEASMIQEVETESIELMSTELSRLSIIGCFPKLEVLLQVCEHG